MQTSQFSQTILFIIFTLSFTANSQANSKFLIKSGAYLGQKPPGLIPEVFAPGIVSINGRHEYGISFSPNLNEIYFSTQKPGEVAAIYSSTIEKKQWKSIKKVNFTNGEKAGEMHPFVTYDSDKIYFTAYSDDYTDTKIWTANRNDNGWGNATKLNSTLNEQEVFYPTLASNGDLFYTDILKSKTYYSALKNGKYLETKEVEIEFGLHPFISPSQDYLLVDAVAKDKNRNDKDIYVFFKNADGSWSRPINLGNTVNSNFYETVPSITPDGKYLFFSRYDEEGGQISNLYWVSTEVIQNLRTK